MRTLRILLIASVVMLFLNTGLFAQEKAKERVEKFGSVDLSRLFDEYQKTKDYDKKLEGEQKIKEAERVKKIDVVKDLQQKQALANDKDKEKIQAQIDEKMKELQEFDREATTDLRKKRDDLLKEILKEIEKVISDYSQKEGYTIVLNDRVLLYGDQSLDITDPLVKILNDKYNGTKKK